uniref:Uncharacterized protein n=1 Tax=Salmo trutta TaxID=8032 RepID=A0A674CUB8_SALTR
LYSLQVSIVYSLQVYRSLYSTGLYTLQVSIVFSLCPQVVYMSLSVCVAVVCVLEVGREVCVRAFGNVRGRSVVVIGKVFVWLCVLLFCVCVQYHHSRVRSRGFLRFYRDNRTLKHLPFIIHSAGTHPETPGFHYPP